MRKTDLWLIAPYAAWMVLMAALPATAAAYAVRTAVVALLLVVGWGRGRGPRSSFGKSGEDAPRIAPAAQLASLGGYASPLAVSGAVTNGEAASSPLVRKWLGRPLFLSFLVGLAVFAIWILPEQFDWGWYRRFCIVGEGGTQAVAEASAAMIAIRLVGSAFVISVAEELFFRKWLIGFAGFGWMVALFALEHDRWLVGAIAGVVYGLLYLRRGLLSAIVAHATTNLVLGLWVLRSGQWQFW